MAIVSAKIVPPVGVMRVGNSEEWFLGPELPGVPTAPADGKYKDAQCRIRRQAARFRIWGYDAAGTPVQELTAADATIEWTVELANIKAASKIFSAGDNGTGLRNPSIADRSLLRIQPGPRTLTAPGQTARFDTGRFLGTLVDLGQMHTEAGTGRLITVGGYGLTEGPAASTFNSNDTYDDTSDGPVTAKVTLADGTVLPVAPAWVICGPPDYAPGILAPTTLYDLLAESWYRQHPGTLPTTYSFTRDVWPILRRVRDLRWVFSAADLPFHTPCEPTPAWGPQGPPNYAATALAKMRPPTGAPAAQATMPGLNGDYTDGTGARIADQQYAALQAWSAAQTVGDWTGVPTPPTTITPEGLTEAALENCIGSALYPGIEASWAMRRAPQTEMFRLDHAAIAPGEMTRGMALPWQNDFWACGYRWWPSARPNDVLEVTGGAPRDYLNGLSVSSDDWSRLGFVVPDGAARLEKERTVACPDLFFVLQKYRFVREEVQALLAGGGTASYPAALWLVVNGIAPADLGYTPGANVAVQTAPTLAFTAGGAALAQMAATCTAVTFENPAGAASDKQRMTFKYDVAFSGATDFPVADELAGVDATGSLAVAGSTYETETIVQLVRQPVPYMIDGPTPWLSTDLRVFSATAGSTRFGQVLNEPLAFIQGALGALNGPNAAAAQAEFDALPTDQTQSKLELGQTVAGVSVFNFALAKVRYTASTVPSSTVSMAFRMFRTAATGMEYEPLGTYRRAPENGPPLLGVRNGDLVSFPCFASARVDSATQPLTAQWDGHNQGTLAAAGQETVRYFGCWLDFNQPTPQFPAMVPAATPDGPFGNRQSLQSLIVGAHQCLVAEAFIAGIPIPPGAAPTGDPRLAQRNLAIQPATVPLIAQTFEIRATVWSRLRPAADELLFEWIDLPRGTRAELYTAAVAAEELLALARRRLDTDDLELIDEFTLGFRLGRATYLPLPRLRRDAPALLTLRLQDEFRGGTPRVIVHQLSGRPRRVVGSFEIVAVEVRDREHVDAELRDLEVFRATAERMRRDDRWMPVFYRYLEQLEERAGALR